MCYVRDKSVTYGTKFRILISNLTKINFLHYIYDFPSQMAALLTKNVQVNTCV